MKKPNNQKTKCLYLNDEIHKKVRIVAITRNMLITEYVDSVITSALAKDYPIALKKLED